MELIINERIINFNTILDGNPTTFLHFKNKEYQILTLAIDSSTLKKLVVYKSLYDDLVYVRDLEEFFSKVDKNKYPNVEQIYRFSEIK